MSFKFRKRESIRKALPRLGNKRLKQDLKDLRHCDTLETVHEIRKGIKETRALLRLCRCGVRNSEYRRCNRALKRAARCLDSARDAHVKLSTFKELTCGKQQPYAIRKIQHALEEACEEE